LKLTKLIETFVKEGSETDTETEFLNLGQYKCWQVS